MTLRLTCVISVIFGIHTPAQWQYPSDASDAIVALTLFWNGLKFQCNVYPKDEDTFYSCDTLNTSTTLQCDTCLSPNPIEYGIQIDNDDWDHVVIDVVIIKLMNGNILHKLYQIDQFCFGKSCTETLTLKDDYNLIPFNISDIYTSLSAQSYVQPQNQSARCPPDGLICNKSNSNCTFLDKYELIPLEKNWFQAQTYCRDILNSSLATITSEGDLKLIVAIRDNNDEYFTNDIWIGFTDSSIVSSENKWKWVDTTPCDSSKNDSCSPFWGPGEPNNQHNDDGGEDCVEIRHQYTFGLFNDIDCGEKRIFFCNNPTFFIFTTTTQQPQLSKTKHFNRTQFIMLLTVVVVSLILMLVICICCLLYYKRYIKQQVKKETRRQKECGADIVDDHEVQPGQYPVFVNDVHISPKSLDGYHPVQKNSVDDADQVVIVHNSSTVEGYAGENMMRVAVVLDNSVKLIDNVAKMDIVEQESSSNDSDMYDKSLIVQEKNTPTLKDKHIVGCKMLESEQKIDEILINNKEDELSDDDIYDKTCEHDNGEITAGNIDGNTIGNVDKN